MWIYIIGIAAVIVGFGAFFGAPYVPSKRREVSDLFDTLIPLAPQDVVLDVGSGDGVVLREVSRRGVRAVGVEINPFFVVLSRALSFRDKKVKVICANFWRMAIPEEVTCVYIFSVGRDGKRLTKKLQYEATRRGRGLVAVCLGNPLPGLKPVATHGAYAKYVFEPLQLAEA